MNGKSKDDELQSGKDCVQDVPFEDLAPATNVDVSNYEQVLNQAFASPRLKNIAITGPYGAGKSSILASYLQSKEASGKNYANLCLRISLAHFQPTKAGIELTDEQGRKPVQKDGEAVSSSYQMEQLLEGKIINQILHKIPAKVAKAAGFKMVDTDKEIESNAFSCLAAAITGILLIYLFIPPLAAPAVRHFAPSYNNLLLLILLVLTIALIAIAVSFSYIHGKDIKTFFSHLQRVKIEGNEIELFQDKDAAYFDKYLDSILYIIDHSGKQFFIFEDIDRFDTTLIFERLKEINELVNAKRKLPQEAPIKFVYLLRDDIFLNKDRAKFFDFLIPIIPVTNTKNSSDKLFAILGKYHLKEAINPGLVRALGLYIEDYRLIINMANEFRIYFAALGQRNRLNPDKMLAMIVYKNLFPRDFVDLQKKKGYVHFLLSKKGKKAFASERRAELEEAAADLRDALIPRDPDDSRDVILEVKAGEGGEESALFAADLLRMYEHYVEKQGWGWQILSSISTELGGYKDVEVAIKAKNVPEDPADGVWAHLKFEAGVHRVQRVPVTESQGRIHTSAAGVLVFAEVDDPGEIEIADNDLRIDVFRSSGPGGQSVNTTDSAVRITHLPTGITVSMQDEKSQIKNRESAMRVLRARLRQKQLEEQAAQEAALRRSQVRTVDRSERVRTYNFPENRISDHRSGYKAYNLDAVLGGELEPVIESLQRMDENERLEAAAEQAKK